jgi:hypothetical protein
MGVATPESCKVTITIDAGEAGGRRLLFARKFMMSQISVVFCTGKAPLTG